MKVIDLLNKIANGEEVPKKIRYNNKTYLFDGEILNYVNEYSEYDFLLEEDITAMLNDEVEIIEEDKKIEKIPKKDKNGDIYLYSNEALEIIDKINEIIDYLEEKKNE